jgi:hypothetical protein
VIRHVLRDSIGNPSGVERIGTGGRDGLERTGEVRQDQPIARVPGFAVRPAVSGHRRGKPPHLAVELGVQTAREGGGDGKAARGQFGGRPHDVAPRESAELLVRERQAANGPRDSRREVARSRQASVDRSGRVQIHRGGGEGGGLLAVVNRRDVSLWRPHDHEPAAPEIARERIGHGQRKARRDGRVNRVATPSQDGGADIGGDVGGRDHEPCPRGDGAASPRLRGGAARNREQKQERNDGPDHLLPLRLHLRMLSATIGGLDSTRGATWTYGGTL